MYPDPEPPLRSDEREQGTTPPPPDEPRQRNGNSGGGANGQGPRDRTPRSVVIRLAAMLLSGAGVLVAGALWATQHGAAALRVLAGDVLALVVLLLAS